MTETTKLLSTLTEQLQQSPSTAIFEGVLSTLRQLALFDRPAFDAEALPLVEAQLERFPSHMRLGDDELIVDLVGGTVPLSILRVVSALDMGLMLASPTDRRRLKTWLVGYPVDGPTIEGVRWRMPEGYGPMALEHFTMRGPMLASPLFRSLRVFDASQTGACVSVFEHPEQVSTTGDDHFLGFRLDEVAAISEQLEVINLFGEAQGFSLPQGWGQGTHPLRKTLRAVNVGGGLPIDHGAALRLVHGSTVQALYAEAGSVAEQWVRGEGEEPFTPSAPWTPEQVRSVRGHVDTLIYGHTGSATIYTPHALTDWCTWFGTDTPPPSWPEVPPVAQKSGKASSGSRSEPEADLAQLQSLLNQPPALDAPEFDQDTWRLQVCRLIEAAHTADPDVYAHTWRPILDAQGELWARWPLKYIRSGAQLTTWSERIPFAQIGATVSSDVETIETLAQANGLERVVHLSLRGQCPEQGHIAELLSKPLTALKILNINFRINHAVAEALCQSPHLKALQELHVAGLSSAALRVLSDAPLSKQLTVVKHIDLDEGAAQTLARSGALPNVEQLRCWNMSSGAAGALAEAHHMTSLTALSINIRNQRADDMARLLQAPQMASVKHLVLDGQSNAFEPLALAAELPALQTLHCETVFEGLPEAPLLAGAPNLKRLTLRCYSSGHNPKPLAACEALQGITALDLSSVSLKAPGVKALLKSPYLDALEQLVLEHVYPTKGNTQAWATLKRWPVHLSSLDLGRNNINHEGLEGFLECGLLPQLRALTLSQNPINPEGMKAICAREALSGLHTLKMKSTAIGDAGAKALARSHLLGLRTLDVSSCDITAVGMRALAKSEVLAGVTTLDLSGNMLGDAGLRALAKSPHLEHLEVLDLGYTGIGDAGLKALAKGPALGRLKRLVLSGNGLDYTGPGVKALKASTVLPDASRLFFLR
ncbi:MAG: hypothetical protein ACE366_23610 [Bradymonadia bacterium]